MNLYTKALVGTVAAAAVAVSSATPALARDRGGIDVGDVIAGAVVLGGIAAVAGSIGNHGYGSTYGQPYGYNDRYNNGYYNNGYYNNGNYNNRYYQGDPRQAVEQCVRYAEQSAGRYSYGRADVTDIRSVDRNSRGYTVRGRIAVNSNNRDWRNGDSYYGRGWNGDYRGWNSNLRGYDAGSFKCRVEYGRIVDLDFSGIRGL
ncbi:hypothetical protein ACFO0A_13285 [Novosphingobium tardum]|uniref:17 kDa surface antigen n=1 Tax=Novosphingobium tardum TaxID=1538021 RepID=A0ABV8RRK3_9SPHN